MNSDFIKSPSFSQNLTIKADFVKSYGCLNVYKVCDLDLICMKLVAYRLKDENDLIGLINDCPYITQDMISQNLVYLYGNDIFLKLSQDSISFVRMNVRK